MANPHPDLLLRRVLIANRGEIAVRLIKSCQKLGIKAIALYVAEDASALHVRIADEACELNRSGSAGYLDVEGIIQICKSARVEAVIPGYGFLSENAGFARALEAQGILFIGPTPETLEQFGLKHTARHLALSAGVPVIPGTDMLSSLEEAEAAAARLKFPVMVKATAGGGGMGLQTCFSMEELRSAVVTVQSRGKTLFHNEGFFLEKYIRTGRHIEAQIFGNGQKNVLFFGERECSVQRRHQKIIEESPSPFVLKHPELRLQIRDASLRLAESVNYRSAGTVEYLVDDDTGDFYFLEMNTRLQVEHGVTELCYNVDLVEMMLLQADAQFRGNQGMSLQQLSEYSRSDPIGHAIEIRVYAENPAKDYSPAPGLLQLVKFPDHLGVRVDSWVESGTLVSPSFDPLIAKIMTHASDRDAAMQAMLRAIGDTVPSGPPTNLDFVDQVLRTQDFVSGFTTTNMLSARFAYQPAALEFLEPGTHTTVQDFPGRLGIPNGVPVSGPMDSVSFRIANMLVGNDQGTEGFEITMVGPRIKFHCGAVAAVCGASCSVTINGSPAPTWTQLVLSAGSELQIGRTEQGARAYLAIRGGLPGVASYLGSKSTTPHLSWGGYQGRTLKTGDFLWLDSKACSVSSREHSPISLPSHVIPKFSTSPCLYTLAGPYMSTDIITSESQNQLLTEKWSVSHTSSRSGIRLDGPSPGWSRKTGGEGGAHPSNMVSYGASVGAVSWTGDTGVILSQDGPSQTGFVVTHSIVGCDLWRLGQLRPGDSLQLQCISWTQAVELGKRLTSYLNLIAEYLDLCSTSSVRSGANAIVKPLDWTIPPHSEAISDGVLLRREAVGNQTRLCIRQSGEGALLCDFGDGSFDLKLRAHAHQLSNAIRTSPPPRLSSHCILDITSLLIHFDPSTTTQAEALKSIVAFELEMASKIQMRFPSRIIHLPVVFDSQECKMAIEKYMLLQRSRASYLPDNIDFIRRCNGLPSRDAVKKCYFETPFVVNAVGWMMGLPVTSAIDPRCRLSVPKYNPARTWNRAGSIGSGGTCTSIYPSDAPGGYMLWGQTIPDCCWDVYGRKKGFESGKPWFFRPFDQVVFHETERAEFDNISELWARGMYSMRIEDSFFDLHEYQKLVEDTREEVEQWRKVQEESMRTESEKEEILFNEWMEEKKTLEARRAIGLREMESELDPNCIAVKSPMIANLWKIQVAVHDIVEAGTVVLILEAMKMEIVVRAPTHESVTHYRVEKITMDAGDQVEIDDVLMILGRVYYALV